MNRSSLFVGRVPACLCTILFALLLQHTQAQDSINQDEMQQIQALEKQRIDAIDKVMGSVVAIYGEDRQGGGSGVLIDPSGIALTNHHVIIGAGVQGWGGLADGKLYRWKLIGTDPGGDVALIQLTGQDAFPFSRLGDSDRVQVGDWALAMGNPFILTEDQKPTVTLGNCERCETISARGRRQPTGLRELHSSRQFDQPWEFRGASGSTSLAKSSELTVEGVSRTVDVSTSDSDMRFRRTRSEISFRISWRPNWLNTERSTPIFRTEVIKSSVQPSTRILRSPKWGCNSEMNSSNLKEPQFKVLISLQTWFAHYPKIGRRNSKSDQRKGPKTFTMSECLDFHMRCPNLDHVCPRDANQVQKKNKSWNARKRCLTCWPPRLA